MHITNNSVAEKNKQLIMSSINPNWAAANTAPNQVGTEEFLRILWPERSSTRGQLGICHSPGVTSWHDLSNEGGADAAEQALQGDTNVYYHCATHDASMAEAQVNNDSATQLSFLWADIYLAEEVMTNGKNYPNHACAREMLERLPVAPALGDHGSKLAETAN